MTSLILAGVGVAGAAILVRAVMSGMKHLPKQMPSGAVLTSYYKGGFDPKMSRREAGLILGELHCIAFAKKIICVVWFFVETNC